MDDWLELTDGSFKGFVFHVASPTFGLDSHGATDISVKSGRRIHKIQRPFVNGQKTIDLGGKGDDVTVDLIFFGPTYLDRFEEFKKVLNEGSSGKLILPDRREAIQASFESMDETSRSGEGVSKSVRVTWTQDEVTATEVAVGAAEGLIPKGVLDAVSTMSNVVSAAGAVLRNNPVLATIRQFETAVSSVTSTVVTAVALGEAVRSRVLTTISNLENSFDTINAAGDQIANFFGGEPDPGGFEAGRVDSETGQPLEDSDADDEVTDQEDPLEAPETEPDTEIEIVSLQTEEGLADFQAQVIALLDDSAESLSSDTDGRTDDVSDSLIEVVNAVRDVVEAASPSEVRLVVTPFELSLAEIMFANEVDLNLLNETLKKNSFINDIHVVPKGSVIRL